MAVLVSDVIGSARDVLLDNNANLSGFYVWSDATLERWLNDVLAEAASIKRDISPQIVSIPLVAGTVQSVPANVLIFMEPYFNVGSGTAITKGNQELLSRRFPSWRTAAQQTDVVTTMHDVRNPVQFQVNPPNNGQGVIQALCGVIPVLSTIGCLPTSNATIPIPDNYRNALVCGIVSKALGANTRRQDIQKAQFYWTMFANGIKTGQMAQVPVSPQPAEGENRNV